MRLTCPNCDAWYEVPGKAIPRAGRDVQCSNCGTMWFQTCPNRTNDTPDDDGPHIVPHAVPASEPEPAARIAGGYATNGNRRELAAGVQSILRQEAEREFRLRAKEVQTTPSPSNMNKPCATAVITPSVPAADVVAPQPRGPFRRGFFAALMLTVVAIVVYAEVQTLSNAILFADRLLNSYVNTVDVGRLWLDQQLTHD
ncbi:MAG: zinc-ribbon domain-containing protein [Rhodobacteraceae bacterium]|nr:zinc-ribbon domain-containing protein [Paracoccaceae bacterium]